MNQNHWDLYPAGEQVFWGLGGMYHKRRTDLVTYFEYIHLWICNCFPTLLSTQPHSLPFQVVNLPLPTRCHPPEIALFICIFEYSLMAFTWSHNRRCKHQQVLLNWILLGRGWVSPLAMRVCPLSFGRLREMPCTGWHVAKAFVSVLVQVMAANLPSCNLIFIDLTRERKDAGCLEQLHALGEL